MIITKTITHRYEVLDVSEKPFMKFGLLRKTREMYGLKVERTCFNCGHKFKDDENTYLAIIKDTTNKLLCEECNKKALHDINK